MTKSVNTIGKIFNDFKIQRMTSIVEKKSVRKKLKYRQSTGGFRLKKKEKLNRNQLTNVISTIRLVGISATPVLRLGRFTGWRVSRIPRFHPRTSGSDRGILTVVRSTWLNYATPFAKPSRNRLGLVLRGRGYCILRVDRPRREIKSHWTTVNGRLMASYLPMIVSYKRLFI